MADNFDLRQYLSRLLSKDDLYYSPFRPPPLKRKTYVRCVDEGEHWTFTRAYSKKPEFIPYSVENIKEISRITKSNELLALNKSEPINAKHICFSDGNFFFELSIFSDGRFYLTSPITKGNVIDLIGAVLGVRGMLAETVSSLWEGGSSISFSAMSIKSLKIMPISVNPMA